MDLTSLYELRARLKASMIAGTELITEDFRLKRAVQAIKPLEAASPVFAKIGQLTALLLDPACEDRAGTLLDAITLLDAVLCTQGAVAVNGEPAPVKISGRGSAVTNAPYSVLNTLLEALSNSGNGRYSYVLSTHEEKPELFEDYRVKAALVQALGASYAELAATAAEWLKESGPEILPLLQADFDPAGNRGKKEMVRRVQVMEAVGGAKANSFYLEQLPKAEKEIKGALIYALRHEPSNAELLMELTRTEKGSLKKMAYWALASMEGEQVREFFTAYVEKKPLEAIPYLAYSSASWASELTAEGLKAQLAPWTATEAESAHKELTKEGAQLMEAYLKVLPGKSGPGICECFLQAASVGNRLDKPLAGEQKKWELQELPGDFADKGLLFSEAVPAQLAYSLMLFPDRELMELAVSLHMETESFGKTEQCSEKAKSSYFQAAVLAMMLGRDPDTCEGWLEERLWKKSLFGRKPCRERISGLGDALAQIYWEEKEQSYVLKVKSTDPADGSLISHIHRVLQPLEGYYTQLLMELKDTGCDCILVQWIQPGNTAYCSRLADYFYQRALQSKDNRIYLEPLKKCGATKCEGLAVRYCRVRGRIAMWELMSYFDRLPGDARAVGEEADRVAELLKKGEVKGVNINMERLGDYILELKARRA